jgi:hypothetical protein
MSVNIPQWYIQQYGINIQLLLQQKGSLLRSAVSSGTHEGKQASPVDQIASVAAQKVLNRFAPMGRVDAVVDRRWVFPVDYDLPQMIDSFDKLRLITDPQSSYVTNGAYAMGRAMDDEIIAAFFGTAKTGEQGATSTTFPSGQVVSVQQGAASPTGLTVAKLREAKRILMTNQVDLDNDPIYAIVKAKQHDNLLSEAQVISTDFNEKPVLVEGRVQRFLGINIIYCERLTSGTDDQAGTSDQIPVFTKSGMWLGIWGDIQTDVSQRKDLQGLPWQAYAFGTFGATRLEEKRVVKVWCR